MHGFKKDEKIMDQFTQVYEKHKELISIAIYKCRIYKNQEHYHQIGMEGLWKAHEKFTGKEDEFAPYAYIFVRNTILNELRTMNRAESRDVLMDNNDTIHSYAAKTPRPQLSDLVTELLAPLKQEDRQLLLALYVQRLKYEEVAQALGITTHSLKKRRDRLIQKLRLQKDTLFND